MLTPPCKELGCNGIVSPLIRYFKFEENQPIQTGRKCNICDRMYWLDKVSPIFDPEDKAVFWDRKANDIRR